MGKICCCDPKTVCLIVLFLINLLNYMDRLTLSGVVPTLHNQTKSNLDQDLDDSQLGLLQTAFVVTFMLLSPVFGFLGDRYNRRLLICFGVVFWCTSTLMTSFCNTYWQLMLCRGMVGIGEASYATIAPTIIADMYVDTARMKALVLFYIGIPAGGALGLGFGGLVSGMLDWRWAFRLTPILGLILVISGYFFILDIERGANEHKQSTANLSEEEKKTGLWGMWEDVKYCCTIPSFVFSTIGFTSVTFATGAFGFWGPQFISNITNPQVPNDTASLMLGFITFITGIFGTIVGAVLSKVLAPKFPYAEPLVCAVGVGIAAPCCLVALYLFAVNIWAAWFMMFITLFGFCLNWALVASIVLEVVVPERRGMAEAIQILMSHMFGDAISPYVVGAISTYLQNNKHKSPGEALQIALILVVIAGLIGAASFFVNTCFYVADKEATYELTEPDEMLQEQTPLLNPEDIKEDSSSDDEIMEN